MKEDYQRSRQHVEEVVRKALGDRTSSELIRAVVDGSGEREEIQRIEKSLGVKPFDLVIFDTDQIGDYVFESSRPPVICGASLILAGINRQIASKFGARTIFSGGGEGLLIAPPGSGSALCRDIVALYEEESKGALSVTTVSTSVLPSAFVPVPAGPAFQHPDWSLVSGTPGLVARIRDEIRRLKSEKGPRSTGVDGRQDRCVACRDRVGTVPLSKYRPKRAPDEPEEPGFLCDACDHRWGVGKRRIDGLSLEVLIKPYAETNGAAARSRYVGFLYSDGNAMGALFNNIPSMGLLRFASLAVGDLFRSVGDRVAALMKEKGEPAAEGGDNFLSFLGGGDEAIWILPGRFAVQVAESLPGWIRQWIEKSPEFTEAVLKPAHRTTLSVGIGLALCEYKYPVRYQFELAKQLLRSAKERFYAAPREDCSALDFEVLTDASPLSQDLEAVRKLAYSSDDPDFDLTQRPYSEREFSDLDRLVRISLKHQVPNNQLYSLSGSAREGWRIFANHLCYQVARNQESYGAWLKELGIDIKDRRRLEDFFIRRIDKSSRRRAWIVDALELRPFHS